MPFSPLLPEIQPLVIPSKVGSDHGPTRAEVRGPAWRRTTAGFYVPSWLAVDPEQRIAEQGHRLRRGVVTGWASLLLHRAAYFDGIASDGRTTRPVPVVENGERLTPSPDRLILRGRIHPEDVAVFRDTVRCATVPRALLDAVRMEPDDREAVVAIDMCLAAGLTTAAKIRAYVESRPRQHGQGRLLVLLKQSEPRSRSPQESRLRQIWEHDADWDRPLSNVEVRDESGAFVGRPDLLDPDRRVIGEYDGAEHRTKSRHSTDVTREAGFRRVGLEVVTVVGDDLKNITLVVDRLHQAEARARAFRPSFRWSK